jgi:hypothetical protein
MVANMDQQQLNRILEVDNYQIRRVILVNLYVLCPNLHCSADLIYLQVATTLVFICNIYV